MQRLAFGIEYDGSAYNGWQRQKHSLSVQEVVEKAISRVAAHEVKIFCAGRTDAGVHAFGQVIHVDTNAIRPEHAWVRGVNTYLPKDIRVLWCQSVSADFDARKSALSRRYCYVISNRTVSPGIMSNAITWIHGELCVESMKQAALYLIGKHDFTSFRGSSCQAKTPIRTIHQLEITQKGELILLDITANAFLHHMVRNITGSLVAIGKKKYPPQWLQTVLAAKDRRMADMMAPPTGLYLLDVSYPADILKLNPQSMPWFIAET